MKSFIRSRALVSLGNKSFGEKIQRIIQDVFELDKPESTGHDLQKKSMGKKFEVKASRFWVSNGDWKWQHIMEDHDYDFLLLIGINFQGIDAYVISKSEFMQLKNQGLVTQQGGAEGQGLWCNFSQVKPFLTPISSKEELEDFIK